MDYDRQRQKLLIRHGGALLAASSLETVFGFPLEAMKIRLQMASNPTFNRGQSLSSNPSFTQLASNSGNSGLYRGAFFQLFGRPFVLSTRFGVYRMASAFRQDGREDVPLGIPDAFVSGTIAGAFESVIGTPFDLIKTRLQGKTPLIPLSPSPSPFLFNNFASNGTTLPPSTPSLSEPFQNHSTTKTSTSVIGSKQLPLKRLNGIPFNQFQRNGNGSMELRVLKYPWLPSGNVEAGSTIEIVKWTSSLEGINRFWTGWRFNMLRDSVYGGIFFGGWMALYRAVGEVEALRVGKDIRDVDNNRISGPLENTLEAAVAATVASVLTNPLDVAVTKRQNIVDLKHIRLERSFLKLGRQWRWWELLSSAMPTNNRTYWRCLGIRSLQHFVSTATLVASYHLLLSM